MVAERDDGRDRHGRSGSIRSMCASAISTARPRRDALRHEGRGQHPARDHRRAARRPATIARGAKAIAAFNAKSPILKKGIALTPVKFGISFTLTHLNQAGALVHVYHRRLGASQPRRHRDGAGALHQGRAGRGGGVRHRRSTGCKITATTTAKVPNTSPTAASSGSDLNGMAAQAAAGAIKERLIDFAAEKYERRRGRRSSSATARCSSATSAIAFGELAKKALSGARVAVLDRLLRDAEDPLGPRPRRAAGRSSISPMARRARK